MKIDDDYSENLAELADHLGIPMERMDEIIDGSAERALGEIRDEKKVD